VSCATEVFELNDGIIIQTNGLTKSYKDVLALDSLDLTVHRNSIFGFLGPNGSGKTTTMKLLLGLIRPTGGGGTVFGRDIARDNLAIRARVGYLPQDLSVYEHMTARQILRFTERFFFHGPKDGIGKRVDEMLEMVGLADKANRPVKGFSGGERQRLGIAQAEINNPDLLILDEPAAALDPIGRHDVLNVLERLREHATVFYSTHILDDVQRVSDTVAILNHGKLVAHGPIGELLAGGGGTVYSVTVTGEVDETRNRISSQAWVSDVQVSHYPDGRTGWLVSVTDQDAARAQLLRIFLADERTVVDDFRLREYGLEEVFIDIVKESEDRIE